MAEAQKRLSPHYAAIRIFSLQNLRHVDWMLPIFVLALAVIGWATMYSASRSSEVAYFYKQIFFFALGLVGVLIIICIDYRFLVALAPLMYLGAIGLLIAVLARGTIVGGSERWLVLGPFRLQPSETTKVIMVYALTWYLNLIGDRIRKLHWFILAFIITAIPMGLILMQPNLGTAACLAPLVIVMIWVAGCRWWHLAVVILIGLSAFPMLWWQMKDFDPGIRTEKQYSWELEHYQKKRIYTFLHPEYDPRGSGWHTHQSMITVGSGGLSGKGYLQGTQTRLNYLPEHTTDFIFSLLAEERGFLGAIVVIGLFMAFLLRGLSYARECPEIAGALLASGIVTILGFHVFVNIAITIGVMPVTGIPLPFLSYGGSFYITTMACVGILLNVPIRKKRSTG